jgi:hypothetical protein
MSLTCFRRQVSILLLFFLTHRHEAYILGHVFLLSFDNNMLIAQCLRFCITSKPGPMPHQRPASPVSSRVYRCKPISSKSCLRAIARFIASKSHSFLPRSNRKAPSSHSTSPRQPLRDATQARPNDTAKSAAPDVNMSRYLYRWKSGSASRQEERVSETNIRFCSTNAFRLGIVMVVNYLKSNWFSRKK